LGVELEAQFVQEGDAKWFVGKIISYDDEGRYEVRFEGVKSKALEKETEAEGKVELYHALASLRRLVGDTQAYSYEELLKDARPPHWWVATQVRGPSATAVAAPGPPESEEEVLGISFMHGINTVHHWLRIQKAAWFGKRQLSPSWPTESAVGVVTLCLGPPISQDHVVGQILRSTPPTWLAIGVAISPSMGGQLWSSSVWWSHKVVQEGGEIVGELIQTSPVQELPVDYAMCFGDAQQVEHEDMLQDLEVDDQQEAHHSLAVGIPFDEASYDPNQLYCQQCDKHFSSTRAFGQHRRWHNRQDGKVEKHGFGMRQAIQNTSQIQSIVWEKMRGAGTSETQCKCGSTTHLRISHKDCPLNSNSRKRPRPAETMNTGQEITAIDIAPTPPPDSTLSPFEALPSGGAESATRRPTCKCGSTTHLRISHKDCPLRPQRVDLKSNATSSAKPPANLELEFHQENPGREAAQNPNPEIALLLQQQLQAAGLDSFSQQLSAAGFDSMGLYDLQNHRV